MVLFTNMDATIVVSGAGEVDSIPPSTLRCLLISDARLVQYPSFPKVEALSSPVFNRTESSAPRLKQKKVRLEFIAKELALFELGKLSQQQGQACILALFWCVYQ